MFQVGRWALPLVLAVGAVWAEGSEDVPQDPVPEGEAVERPEEARVSSVTQTLQEDSGISVQTMCTNCNNADLSLGGLSNEHIAMVCDGIPVPQGLAQVYLLSILPPTAIDKVSVTRGPGEAELGGGAVGGGIEIERHRPAPGLALNAAADAGQFGWKGSRLDVSGKTGPVGGSILASVAESDAVDSNGDTSNELPEFNRQTVEAGVGFEISRNDHVRFGYTSYDERQKGGHAGPIFGIISFSPFQQGFVGYGKEFVELDRDQFDGLYERSFTSGALLTVEGLFADRSQDVREIRDQFGQQQDTFLIDEDHSHGSAAWDQPLGNRTTMHFGASGTRREFEVTQFEYLGIGQSRDDSEETVDERGVWVSAETALGGSIELDTGVRWVDVDYTDNETRVNWTPVPLPTGSRLLPRAALTWKPSDPVQLRFSLGAGFRAPEPIHEEVCCGRDYRSNRGVATEKSWAAGIETIFQPSPRFKLAGSAFLTDFEDLVVKMVGLSFQFTPTYQNVNVEEARYLTVGFETRFDATRWMALKAAGSWLDASNETPGGTIVAMLDVADAPYQQPFHTDRIPYVVERRGSVGLSFAPAGRSVTFDVSTQYTGDMLIQRFDPTIVDPITLSDSIEFVESEDFWIANAAMRFDFPSGISLNAGVDNIGDQVQSDLGDPHFDYKWGAQRGRYIYAGLGYRFATN